MCWHDQADELPVRHTFLACSVLPLFSRLEGVSGSKRPPTKTMMANTPPRAKARRQPQVIELTAHAYGVPQ